MAEFHGTVELISGITPKNGGDFALVGAHDVQVDDQGNRLDTEFSNLKSALNISFDGIRTITNYTDRIVPEYYVKSNAKGYTLDPTDIVNHSTYQQKSGYYIFSVKKDDTVVYYGRQFNTLSMRNLTFTDSEYNVLYGSQAGTVAVERELKMTATADGYCFVNVVMKTNGVTCKYALYHINNDEYTQIKKTVTQLSDCENIVQRDFIWIDAPLINGEWINSSGEIKQSSTWSRTDYINCSGKDSLHAVNDSAKNMTYNCFYNSEHEMIGSRFEVPIGENIIQIPSDASYVIFSAETTTMQKFKMSFGEYNVVLADALPLTDAMNEEVNSIIDERPASGGGGFVYPNAYIMRTFIPNYYFDRNEIAQSKDDIGYLDNKINSIPDGYHFIFVTDTHWNDNAKQSTKLISYVKDRIGAKFVLFGGDILTAHATEAIAYRWLCDFVFDYKNAFGSNFLPVVGNHDLNAAGDTNPELMYSDLVPLFIQGCDNRFHYCDFYDSRIDAMASSKGMTTEEVAAMKQYFRTCYYVDDIEGKTRFIVYNTGAGDGGSGIRQYIDNYIKGSYEELVVIEWVYDCLINTPEGFNVILSTHIPGDFSWEVDGGTFLSSARQRFAAMVAGLKAKQTITVYLPNGISDYSWWGSSTLIFDYVNAPDTGTVAVIGGHFHVDKFGKYGFTNANYTSTNISSVQGTVNGTTDTCYQSSTTYVEGEHMIAEVPVILSQHDAYTRNSGPRSHSMTLGTITEQVVDVVTITPTGNIALTRIGAGNDRYLTVL